MKAQILLLTAAISLLEPGCNTDPKINAACASLSNADLEAAIPGVAFQPGFGSMTNDEGTHISSDCQFTATDKSILVNAVIYDGEP